MEKFLYWVALPALLVFKLSSAPVIGPEAVLMSGVLTASAVGGGLVEVVLGTDTHQASQ